MGITDIGKNSILNYLKTQVASVELADSQGATIVILENDNNTISVEVADLKLRIRIRLNTNDSRISSKLPVSIKALKLRDSTGVIYEDTLENAITLTRSHAGLDFIWFVYL